MGGNHTIRLVRLVCSIRRVLPDFRNVSVWASGCQVHDRGNVLSGLFVPARIPVRRQKCSKLWRLQWHHSNIVPKSLRFEKLTGSPDASFLYCGIVPLHLIASLLSNLILCFCSIITLMIDSILFPSLLLAVYW